MPILEVANRVRIYSKWTKRFTDRVLAIFKQRKFHKIQWANNVVRIPWTIEKLILNDRMMCRHLCKVLEGGGGGGGGRRRILVYLKNNYDHTRCAFKYSWKRGRQTAHPFLQLLSFFIRNLFLWNYFRFFVGKKFSSKHNLHLLDPPAQETTCFCILGKLCRNLVCFLLILNIFQKHCVFENLVWLKNLYIAVSVSIVL
jgi:hypothetical protein